MLFLHSVAPEHEACLTRALFFLEFVHCENFCLRGGWRENCEDSEDFFLWNLTDVVIKREVCFFLLGLLNDTVLLIMWLLYIFVIA